MECDCLIRCCLSWFDGCPSLHNFLDGHKFNGCYALHLFFFIRAGVTDEQYGVHLILNPYTDATSEQSNVVTYAG